MLKIRERILTKEWDTYDLQESTYLLQTLIFFLLTLILIIILFLNEINSNISVSYLSYPIELSIIA